MVSGNKNQRVAMFAVLAALLLALVIYFGYIYGFMAAISDKERQRLNDLAAKHPELGPVISEAEKDGKITELEYWEIVDAYKEKEYKKYLESK